jgi:hypothetical protein
MALTTSPPAENPIIPILFESSLYSRDKLRTILIALIPSSFITFQASMETLLPWPAGISKQKL